MNGIPSQFGRLLAHLHRGGAFGFWCYESAARKPLEDRPIERASVWWRCADPAGLPDLTGPHGLRHVWFGVHPCAAIPTTNTRGEAREPRWVRSQSDYISAVNCLYAEFDAKDFGAKEDTMEHIEDLALAPSVIIDSGGGYHCYWLLDQSWLLDDTNRSDARALQHAWVAAVGGDGGAKNLNRVLRVPGSLNVKESYGPDYPRVAFVKQEMERLYTLDDLRATIPQDALDRVDYDNAPQVTLDDYARAGTLVGMLSSHRRDNYQDWIEVGQSLASLGSAGLAIWDSWSRGGSNYKPGECEKKWSSFGENGRTFASLVFWAKEDSPSEYERLYGRKSHDPKGAGTIARSVTLPDHEDQEPTEDDPYILSSGGADDEGNASMMYRLYGDQFLHCDAYGWLHWSGSHWERTGAEDLLIRAIVDTLIRRRVAATTLSNEHVIKSSKPSATNVRSCKYLFQSKVGAPVDSFDCDLDLLNVANGTIHLPTGELRKHNPADRLTYCVSIDLRMDADDSAWVNFLRGVVHGEGDENEEVVKYLQKSAGYSLTGHTSEEVLWYIHGPSRSGKGTFSETLLSILGSPLSTEVDFSTFTRDRDNDASNFDLAPLKPARMIFASESERHQRINSAKIKALTGGNQIQCCYKHRDHFSYRPQYKIWLTSNHPPNADVDDDAVWGRLRVLVFPHSHLGSEDKGLKHAMKDRRNLEGVLAWAVEGARQWYGDRNSGLATPGHVVSETNKARTELDTVGQWIEESLEIVEGEEGDWYLPNAELYQHYSNWCDENGVSAKQKRALTQSLNNKGIQGPKIMKRMGKTVRGWVGVRWL